jgi:hypothetical protein
VATKTTNDFISAASSAEYDVTSTTSTSSTRSVLNDTKTAKDDDDSLLVHMHILLDGFS